VPMRRGRHRESMLARHLGSLGGASLGWFVKKGKLIAVMMVAVIVMMLGRVLVFVYMAVHPVARRVVVNHQRKIRRHRDQQVERSQVAAPQPQKLRAAPRTRQRCQQVKHHDTTALKPATAPLQAKRLKIGGALRARGTRTQLSHSPSP